MHRIGIRKEYLTGERRAPIAPEHIAALRAQSVKTSVQTYPDRVFAEQAYLDAGAAIDDLEACKVIFGLKELPADRLQTGKVHAFFSHTIQGPTEKHAHAPAPDGTGMHPSRL